MITRIVQLGNTDLTFLISKRISVNITWDLCVQHSAESGNFYLNAMIYFIIRVDIRVRHLL